MWIAVQYLLVMIFSFYSCQFQNDTKNKTSASSTEVEDTLAGSEKVKEMRQEIKSLETENSNPTTPIKPELDIIASYDHKEDTTSLHPEEPIVEVEKEVKANDDSLREKEAPIKESVDPPEKIKQSIDHNIWTNLLVANVSPDGRVNYAGIKQKSGELEKYLNLLTNNPPLSTWSEKAQLAYWINVYNAYTVKLIIDHYPVTSITDLHNGKPWDVKWINIGNKTYSLNQIENEIIRPQFREPRIHFAVNCAALSCPPLINQAYTEENLESLLQANTQAFINNSQYNTFSKNKIEISKIFEWYKEDFGNLIDYINKYATSKINANAKISYKEYNWDLNQQ